MARARTPQIGGRFERIEDPPLVTGRGRFAADISFPHQLHVRIVRSAHAHGIIRAIDKAAALAHPGVFALWTADDIPEVPPIDFREGRIERLEAYRQPVLARGRVRYVGEPIAAVFADDAYVAEDAAELVMVDIEELPPILDACDPPGEWEPGRSTEPGVLTQGYGDMDEALAAADQVIELDLQIGRHSGVPMETRGAIARYDAATDTLELYGAAKIPHRNRDALARTFGRAPSSVQLYEGHTGGGFGIRGELYPEDLLVSAAAMRFERPVKWIEDRHEHLMTANQSRQQRHRAKIAVKADGTILGIDDEFFHDQGAYPRTHAMRVVDMTLGILPGPYRVPAYRVAGHYRLTNKTPAATYRSPGRYESSFVRERLVDAVADRLGLDRLAVRRKNLISAAEMPYLRPLIVLGEDAEFDSGDYHGLLDRALEHIGWDALQADLRRRREAGEAVGAGIAIFVEKSGAGPADGARVSVDSTGAVEVVTGGASIGQGFETAMAQICADALGVDYKRVRVVHGQTDRIAYGIGAHASRATVMTGNATHIAALAVRRKALEVAAELLQAPIEALDVVDGEVVRTDRPAGGSIALGAIAASLHPNAKTLGAREPGLAADGWHRTEHLACPYGIHIAVVGVDRETGAVTVEKFLIAYDVGRAVNPMMVEGQIVGGFMQGLGGALYEEFVYDERGQPQSVTFADYLMPTMSEAPEIEIILREDCPSPRNPLGIKGAGEAGINSVGAVIASAIDVAIGMPGAVTQLPVSPQRLKAIFDRGR
ncbi:MAG: xanthine dehydrogenase family protein molybdopterin-binding subunit [Alphaproteobacteria bacterium]|nr:xanthine dehydrogenase family protein molybdopterin-binding subunit [Alphaproteobacteria bacterium]